MTVVHLYNRNPSMTLGGRSPFKALFDKSLEYDQLRVFGSKCF